MDSASINKAAPISFQFIHINDQYNHRELGKVLFYIVDLKYMNYQYLQNFLPIYKKLNTN